MNARTRNMGEYDGKCVIIEDNERNMRLMRLLLRPQGYTLHEATSGQEALDLLKVIAPDIILVDIQLPDIDGLEITRRLRQDCTLRGDADCRVDCICDARRPGMFLRGRMFGLRCQAH